MQIETLGDVLQWTREFHSHLARNMSHCADHHESERVRLLLDYLIEHEEKLSHLLKTFQKSENQHVLTTKFIGKQPVIKYRYFIEPFDTKHFNTLSTAQIIKVTIDCHKQIIELYRDLSSSSEIPEVRRLLNNLQSLEKYEVMLMSQAANQLEDV